MDSSVPNLSADCWWSEPRMRVRPVDFWPMRWWYRDESRGVRMRGVINVGIVQCGTCRKMRTAEGGRCLVCTLRVKDDPRRARLNWWKFVEPALIVLGVLAVFLEAGR